MRNGKVSKAFCVLAYVAVVVTIVSMFMLYVRTVNAPPLEPGAECGPMPTLGYVTYGGLAGTLAFGLLAFLTDPRGNDSDSV